MSDIDHAIYYLDMVGLTHDAEAVRRLRGELIAVNRLFRPITWTREQDAAWHRNIPDVAAAFSALRATVGDSAKP